MQKRKKTVKTISYQNMNVLFKFSLYFLLVFWYINALEANVLIITHSYNRPDFIEIQDQTFKKFLKDDYTFVVFNDAPEDEMANNINETCEKLQLSCVRIPQSIHQEPYLSRNPGDDYQNPAVRCANVVQYSLDILGFQHEGIVAIIDADMFLIKEFSIIEYLKDSQLAGVPQKRQHIHYIWNGLVFFNMNTLPDKDSIDFNCKKVEGILVDVGGNMYYYLKNHLDLKVSLIPHEYIKDWNVLSAKQMKYGNIRFLYELNPNNIEFLLDYSFLHYRSGTNWDYRSTEYHKSKTEILNIFIEKILNDCS